MSTRANIIITKPSWDEKLYFYRHSDGYPEGVQPTLDKFVELINTGKLRPSVSQSSGWLILLGTLEYKGEIKISELIGDDTDDFHGWKIGAYEPTTCLHGDINHLYIIDMDEDKVSWKEVPESKWWEHKK